MKLINSKNENGGIYAEIIIEAADMAQFSTAQKAIEYYIMAHAKSEGISSLLFTRVTKMDEKADGDLEVHFEAAISPKVVLGRYKGVPVDIGHCEDFEEAAVTAAANNMEIALPLLIVERKLDTLTLEKEAELLQSVSLNTLSDVYAILKELSAEQDDDSRWTDAMEIAESYLNMGMQDIDYFAQCISDVCFDADEEEISKAVVRRAESRGSLAPELLATQVFQAYLHTQNMTNEQWREQLREEAERQCKVDFLLSAVVEAESITASDAELDKAAYDLAAQYQMSDKDVLMITGEEAIRHQIKMAKARKLIVENANNI